MKNTDTTVPRLTAQMVSVCTSGDSRPRPNTHSPMNVDSAKNATNPSMASGTPKMLPTKTE